MIFLRNNVKRVSINMEALDFGVIVLEDNLNKAFVCRVDDRTLQTWRYIVSRSLWEIQFINSVHFMLIRKPHGRDWVQK